MFRIKDCEFIKKKHKYTHLLLKLIREQHQLRHIAFYHKDLCFFLYPITTDHLPMPHTDKHKKMILHQGATLIKLRDGRLQVMTILIHIIIRP